ncbi:hypothetical protein BDV95DRAFT_584825 [Massariosphaeria phaeospora]|uniref:Ribosomal protein/NADH dehydrogenase domain-containing protein n=1 Tax=Massariosphaeria phaeospora TaxID=100035 RepID=A0A7C8HZB8_9PLEO|nr:hypothetical protein BDV95DRAFT_584825 [Massariosphaeria phaeospora]
MVHIVSRMRKLRELLWVRVGPGAIILPKEVSKITMEFCKKLEGGHRGPRHFWHEMLPRVKYRNPSIPIHISRHSDPAGPSLLHIYTTPSSTTPTPTSTSPLSSTPPSATPNARTTLTPDTSAPTHTIPCLAFSESQILEQLIETTGAVVVQPTPQETEELAEIEDFKRRSEKDRVEVREKLMKVRREQELLKMARGEVASV